MMLRAQQPVYADRLNMANPLREEAFYFCSDLTLKVAATTSPSPDIL